MAPAPSAETSSIPSVRVCIALPFVEILVEAPEVFARSVELIA